MQFAIVSIALISWMFLVFPVLGADSDDMDSDSDSDSDAEGKAESAAECLNKHGGRCVKECAKDEKQIQNCAEGFCCSEKCD